MSSPGIRSAADPLEAMRRRRGSTPAQPEPDEDGFVDPNDESPEEVPTMEMDAELEGGRDPRGQSRFPWRLLFIVGLIVVAVIAVLVIALYGGSLYQQVTNPSTPTPAAQSQSQPAAQVIQLNANPGDTVTVPNPKSGCPSAQVTAPADLKQGEVRNATAGSDNCQFPITFTGN